MKTTEVGNTRFVSRLTRHTLALILAGGRGSRLCELTDWRAKPAVPFGGKFRIIDFPLSNCFNSGIRRVGVLTQYKAHSLIRHLVRGWAHYQNDAGEFVEVLPASQRMAEEKWYAGTADAVYQNLDIIRAVQPDYVLILAGDHIYKMDYGEMLAFHIEHEADMTVSCLEVPITEAAGAFGVMSVDQSARVVRFAEKPSQPEPAPENPSICLASMGNYVFNTDFLYRKLIEDADDDSSDHDFGKNVIPSLLDRHRVFAYPFRDPRTGERAYWRDVGTLDAYWEANMELVSVVPELNLYDRDWPVLTYQMQLPPAKFVFDDVDRRGQAIDSMVSGGCIISGATVRRSLLFSNVTVAAYAQVSDSVVLPDVAIGRRCRVKRAIVDRGCRLEQETVIGEDHAEDRRRGFRVTDSGIVLVTPDMLGQPVHMVR
ncbi:MAG: glucose-1-phosphate adenylyltransferase [Gammaproteobacteria bacterium]